LTCHVHLKKPELAFVGIRWDLFIIFFNRFVKLIEPSNEISFSAGQKQFLNLK
jgi:hypothetical protein